MLYLSIHFHYIQHSENSYSYGITFRNIFFTFLFCSLGQYGFSQDSRQYPYAQKTRSETTDILLAPASKSLNEKTESRSDEKFEYIKSVQINLYKAPVKTEENFRFNLIESINSNVKFGGFYNGSVNIQFSPAMYIKPFSFLSIYANHQKNLFIPMQSIQENALPLAVEASGMVIIETVVKVFSPPDKIVRGLAEFTLKNCISLLIYSIFNSGDASHSSGVYKHDFYYISAGITF